MDMATTIRLLDETAVEALRAELRGPVIAPGDAEYDQARQVWNGMIDRRPAMIARVAGAADVITCVNFARSHDVVLAVRGGAHNVPGNAVCDGGLVVDFSAMKAIRVDPAQRRARAEPGVKWGEFDREVQAFGLATTSGTFSDTGIAGLTLGGGMGWLGGKFGLVSDNVLSFDVVTADGRLRTVSPDEEPDLFWALRGGGGNFGVVTSFEYRLHPVGTLLAGPVFYPFDHARAVLRFYRDFASQVPDELVTAFGFLTLPDGGRAVGIVVVYNGPLEAGEAVIRPVRELGQPIVDQIGPMSYTAVQTMFDPLAPTGRHYYVKAPFLREIQEGAIEALVDAFAEVPSPASIILLQQKSGAMARGRADQTAFGHREDQFAAVLFSGWDDPTQAEANIGWTRRLAQDLEPFGSGGEYINELGPMDRPDHVRASFGANYDRLAALKEQWDPTNVFRHTQNLKPTV
jgi:FAD/FMN-containing dehydrogenase